MASNNTERPRTANGQYAYTPEAAAKDAKAAELRAQGWTYQQIADELGYSHRRDAQLGIRHALKLIVQRPAEKLIEQEAVRLDTLYEEALEILQHDHVMVSHGRIVYGDDGTPLRDDGPKLQAIDRLVKVRESYRRLFGLDRPVKVDATVTEVTQQDLELQEMLREAKARMTAEEQQILDGPAEG